METIIKARSQVLVPPPASFADDNEYKEYLSSCTDLRYLLTAILEMEERLMLGDRYYGDIVDAAFNRLRELVEESKEIVCLG